MAGLIERTVAWLTRRNETTLTFTDHSAVDPGPRVVPPPQPAWSVRPGAGSHANNCVYLNDPEHRCVTESGQPSNQVCIATWYRTHRLPKKVGVR